VPALILWILMCWRRYFNHTSWEWTKSQGMKGVIEHKEVVKLATNFECIQATEKQMDPSYLKNHVVKPKEICNNVENTQTDKRIKSSYRFQPLSKISDNPDGNRNNPKLKSAGFEEAGNVIKKIFTKQELQMKFRNFNITFKTHQQCTFSSKLFNLTYWIPNSINCQITVGNNLWNGGDDKYCTKWKGK